MNEIWITDVFGHFWPLARFEQVGPRCERPAAGWSASNDFELVPDHLPSGVAAVHAAHLAKGQDEELMTFISARNWHAAMKAVHAGKLGASE